MEGISTAASVSGASGLGYDVFVDLSASSLSRQQFHEYVEALASDAGMGARTMPLRLARRPSRMSSTCRDRHG